MANINGLTPETLTVAGTALGLASVPAKASRALIYVETGSIRWWSGATPTATVGMFQAAGSYIDWTDSGHVYSSLLNNARFIRTSGTSATLSVQYFN